MGQGKAPGTNTRGGVNSTMENANKVSSTPAGGEGLGAPFDQARSGGNSGSNIPTITYDRTMPDPKVPPVSYGQGTTPVLGGQGGQKRPGTK